ncbi:hypothetical protein, partial [Kamptonema formosum]|uniref:hypothetical protein n=1 Tax=Kamptonema formosum TaxID=331992 RepID=UPI001E6460E4
QARRLSNVRALNGYCYIQSRCFLNSRGSLSHTHRFFSSLETTVEPLPGAVRSWASAQRFVVGLQPKGS